MIPIRRINIFGAPNSSKSTTAAALFADLKRCGYKTELCREYVKNWSYENRPVGRWDQWYLLSKQLRTEQVPLQNGCNFIISDCPLELGLFYAYHNSTPEATSMWKVIQRYAIEFPAVNILLKRGDKLYEPYGRYHSEEQAKVIDRELMVFLSAKGINYQMFVSKDYDDILNYVKDTLSTQKYD